MKFFLFIGIMAWCSLFFHTHAQNTYRKTYAFSSMDIPGGIISTSDGGYLFCGFNSNFVPIYGNITKTDQDGNITWSKGYLGSIATALTDVIELSSALGGGYVAVGESNPGAIAIRIDANGNLVWARRYRFPNSSGEFFTKIIQTTDNNLLACGGVSRFWDGSNYRDSLMPMAIKINPANGNIIWDRVFVISVPNPDEHCFTSVTETSDGYIFVGYSSEGSGTLSDGDYPSDGLIIKTNASGTLSYAFRFGASNESQGLESIITLSGGTNVLASGFRGDEGIVVRFQATGTPASFNYGHRYSRVYAFVFPEPLYFTNVMQTSDNHYAVIGTYIRPYVLPFEMYATITKINNSTGAVIWGRTFVPTGTLPTNFSILPEGGVAANETFHLFMTHMNLPGYNYHFIRTNSNGQMVNTTCPEGSYTPTRNNYTPTLTSFTPTVFSSLATVSSFTPAVNNLNPTVTTVCFTCTPPPNPTVTASPSATICQGQSVTLNASGSGSNVTYHYYTTSTGGTPFASGNSTVVSPTSTTIYYVAAEDNSNPGCMSNRTPITITVNPLPNVSLAANPNPICQGQSTTITASGANSYSWSHGLGTGNSKIVSPSTNTTYSVTGTDGNNCSNTAQITITVNPNPAVSISASQTTICQGSSTTLTASGANSYSWSHGLGSNNPVNVSPSSSTTYTVTGTNAQNCSGSAQITITVNPLPSVTVSASSNPICQGQTTTISASGADQFTWNQGLGTGSSHSVSPASTTTYTVTGTSTSTNCSNTAEITITVLPLPSLSTSASNNPICLGQSTTISVSGADQYNWSHSLGSGSSHVVSPSASTTYSVTGTNTATGCSNTAQVTVNVNPLPAVALSASHNPICVGESTTIAASGALSYTWSHGLPPGASHVVSPAATTTYQVTGTDINNCSNSAQITITVVTQADATITTTQTTFCTNDPPLQFTAVDPGGTWSGQGISPSGLFNPSAAGAGTHLITYSIPGSCGDTDNITITVHQAPSVSLGSDITQCEGTQVILDAGSGFASYNWSPSGNTQTIQVTTSGTYSVTVTNANNCSGSAQINVTFLPQADATITTSQTEFCLNDPAIQFTAAQSGGTWSGNGINAAGSFIPSAAGVGSHTISYTISGLCGDTDSKIITVNPLPDVQMIFDDESCRDAQDGWAAALATGGTPPYSFLWNNQSQNDTITNLPPGNYTVIVTDAKGCQTTGQVTISASNEDCKPPHVYIPNVFSPNGDGENDILYVYGEGIRYLELVIYNRWGEKIFETTELNIGWDGTYKGELCPPGVYVYVLNVTFYSISESKNFSGTITLVR